MFQNSRLRDPVLGWRLQAESSFVSEGSHHVMSSGLNTIGDYLGCLGTVDRMAAGSSLWATPFPAWMEGQSPHTAPP